MIRSTINYINTQLETLDLFSKLNGLTAVERKTDREYPAIYSGGEKDAINFDFSTGSVYHRLIGSVTISQTEDETEGCEIMMTETYRMRLVAYFPKKVLNNDDAYIELKIANNIKRLLAIHNNTLVQNTYGLYNVTCDVNSIDTDAYSVWSSEFKGIDYRVPSSHCLISIDYSIILTGNTTCFYEYDCE